MNKTITSKEKKLQHIIELERKLNDIQDVDVLLERILTEARRIVNADAGSIYVVSDGNLQIRHAQNDTQLKKLAPGEKLPYVSFSFPINEKSVSGYVAETGECLNIPDAYNIPDTFSFKFNKQTDILTGYRTKSIYTMPLKMSNGVILGVLQIINARDEEGNTVSFDEDAALYLDHFASNTAHVLQHAYNMNDVNRRMLRLSEFRDPKETYPHVERVSKISVEIYDRWAFDHAVPYEDRHKFRDNLKIAAMLHDVGKVGISDSILKLPRIFTPEEYNMIKAHTVIGAMFFSSIESGLDEMSLQVALHHHDRWDGGGYPGEVDIQKINIDNIPSLINQHPLSGEDIPLCARIVSLADVYDALCSKRVYKDAWDDDSVLKEIAAQSGKQFDPEVVKAFFEIQPIIRSIKLAWPEN